jgi:[ribosomal protein S5]-alanine N-acetyltransferase
MKKRTKQPTLNTPRLILNPFILGDASEVQAICSNRMIADTTAHIPHPYNKTMAEDWIQTHQNGYENGTLVCFAMRSFTCNHLIGAISLAIDQTSDRGELGYWIREEDWKIGYCTEAGQAILAFGFEHLKVNKIKAEHLTRNSASGKVLQKLGFKKEGILKQHFKKWDVYEDIAVYGLCRADYRP